MNLVRGHPRAAFMGLIVAGLISATAYVAFPAHGDELTISQDALRTGWDQSESALDPASVASSDFGQQFAATLDGQVYAQPLVVGSTLIAATENDKVYGLDKSTGAILWTDDFGPYWPAVTIGCSDLTPNLGITSAPVYDNATGYVYLVSKVDNGTDAMHPNYYMHAVDPNAGTEKSGFPVLIGGHPSNDPAATFDPAYEGQRPGLLLMDGVVYAAFGSHCDFGSDFRGYIAGVSTAGKQTALWSDETGTGNKGGGIWAGGGGLVSDGSGQILFATGNGVSPAIGPGGTPPGNLAESVVRLHVNADGSLAPSDFFSPSNAPTMDANDTDFGAGGPLALPDGFGTAAHPHLMVQMGKDGRLFLLDRDNLGGRGQGAGGTDAVLGMVGPYQGQWGHPAFYGGDGGYVYLIGNGGPLRAFKVAVSGSGIPALTPAGTSAGSFNYTSGSPVVTSDGTTPGTAVVWAVWSSGPTGANAELRAYSAEPDGSGTLAELWSAPIGTAVKFVTPATSGGRVYVGTRDGKVLAFGRPSSAPLTGSPVSFGDVQVGTTGSATLTVTASTALSVTAVTATSPFTAAAPDLPHAMNGGDTYQIPVSFAPGGPGTISGTVTLNTSAGKVSFTASGYGTQPGLGASPPNAVFPDQPVSLSKTQNIQVTNTGTTTETISAVTTPAAPYSVTGLPAIGTVIPAGGSFVASATYAPTATGTNTDSITVTSTEPDASARVLTISLTGNAIVGQGNLVVSPWPLNFGSVPLGSTATQSFTITNTGNIPVTVTKAKAPDSDFTSASPLPEGQVIGPDQTYVQSVTFTPTALGAESAQYEMTSDDGQGAEYLPINGTAVATLSVVPTGWQANGVATVDGSTGTIQLTPATAQFVAGSAFNTSPVGTADLAASFTAQLSGGTGADGLTFSLIDATKDAPTSLGGAGGGLGLGGLSGIGVVLDTYQNAQANSANYVAIATGTGSGSGAMTYLATAPVPAPLRTGTHKVAVTVLGGVITVYVDAARLLSYTPAAGLIPASAYAGFTAGSGMETDVHAVSGIAIASSPAAAVAAAPAPSPATVSFAGTPVSFSVIKTVTFSNSSLVPVVVTGVTVPTGELSAPAVPAIGTLIPAGGSVTIQVVFTPKVLGIATGALALATSGGTATVSIRGATWPLPGLLHPVKVSSATAR
ncbi:choice-of-anchor D domain-containing protein [Actinocrinis puniceicyclus]|uniref:Choice-of-anchor D domain-containing protein n=1 Tax=Actinocrinis puniceicyclus TaxID=977794 RepID=A0A8J8B9K7_9ACTN|nr:choice-of-anchor D domain-containing protein [Actinocrinis puniceicyclus]MBS2961942.1 choice-of-anchor D domain-containing protein [Actinocrinis puniceicyclus]